jgi:hypothetical protein
MRNRTKRKRECKISSRERAGRSNDGYEVVVENKVQLLLTPSGRSSNAISHGDWQLFVYDIIGMNSKRDNKYDFVAEGRVGEEHDVTEGHGQQQIVLLDGSQSLDRYLRKRLSTSSVLISSMPSGTLARGARNCVLQHKVMVSGVLVMMRIE